MTICTTGKTARWKTWLQLDGITKKNVDDEEEDVVGDSQGPQGNPAHAALIASGSDGPAPELQ